MYEAAKGEKVNSAYGAAVRDYLKAPSIEQVDTAGYTGQVGNKILILAYDDFRVESVSVAITTATGTAIENGAAVINANGEWEYTVKTASVAFATNKMQVQAKDKPGNITMEVFPK